MSPPVDFSLMMQCPPFIFGSTLSMWWLIWSQYVHCVYHFHYLVTHLHQDFTWLQLKWYQAWKRKATTWLLVLNQLNHQPTIPDYGRGCWFQVTSISCFLEITWIRSAEKQCEVHSLLPTNPNPGSKATCLSCSWFSPNSFVLITQIANRH